MEPPPGTRRQEGFGSVLSVSCRICGKVEVEPPRLVDGKPVAVKRPETRLPRDMCRSCAAGGHAAAQSGNASPKSHEEQQPPGLDRTGSETPPPRAHTAPLERPRDIDFRHQIVGGSPWDDHPGENTVLKVNCGCDEASLRDLRCIPDDYKHAEYLKEEPWGPLERIGCLLERYPRRGSDPSSRPAVSHAALTDPNLAWWEVHATPDAAAEAKAKEARAAMSERVVSPESRLDPRQRDPFHKALFFHFHF